MHVKIRKTPIAPVQLVPVRAKVVPHSVIRMPVDDVGHFHRSYTLMLLWGKREGETEVRR